MAGKQHYFAIFLLAAMLSINFLAKAIPDSVQITTPFAASTRKITESNWISQVEERMDSIAEKQVLGSSTFYGNNHLLVAREHTPIPLERGPATDWILWVVVLSLGVLSAARLIFPHRTRQFIGATLGGRHFSQMEREGSFFDESPAWLLFANYLLMTALLIYQTLLQTGYLDKTCRLSPFLIFLIILTALLVYYPIKSLLTSFFAWVFGTGQANNAYTKNIFLFNNLAGILILPIVVYNTYQPADSGLYIAWGLLVLINIAKILRGAYIGHTQAGFSVYYLILYLCAIELAPLLIFAKAAGSYLMTL